jgi:hypothetical protein
MLVNGACIGAHLERLFAGSIANESGGGMPRYTDGR